MRFCPMSRAVAMSTSTTAALHELLSTVYHLEFNERISQSGLQLFLDRVKNTLRFIPWKSSVCVDETWRRGVADKQVESLSASRLSKTICAQFRSNLVRAHDRFTLALRELEVLHSARLQETDEARCEVSTVINMHLCTCSKDSRLVNLSPLYFGSSTALCSIIDNDPFNSMSSWKEGFLFCLLFSPID